MLIKYRSSFLLIRIRAERLRLTFPVPFFLLVQVIEAIASLLWIGEKLLPQSVYHKLFFKPQCGDSISQFTGKDTFLIGDLRLVFRIAQDFLNELRQYGRWSLVEVETGKSWVSIGFI